MSVNIYSVTKTKTEICDYEVKINGQTAALDTARVSAYPFNRRWPGHQRSKDQSELINFVSLESDEPMHFEITPKKAFDKAAVRPLALGIIPEVKDGVISFTLDRPAYFTVEPYARRGALHIFADKAKEYKLGRDLENVIYFGRGEHDAGLIELKSNQTLFLDQGAVVYACVKAIDAENIKIIGRGILDNSKNEAQIFFEHSAENNDSAINNARREHTVQLEYCTNVEIEGITIRDSLVYNIRPIGCKNVHISNVKVIGCWRYNSDGIDMHNCEDVLIENCFLRTFDDSICVKGFDCYYEGDVEEAVRNAMYRNGRAYDLFKNAVIRNCTIWNDWGKCLEIGAETRGEQIYNIVFEDCNIIHVDNVPLDCCNIDYADVHDVSYRNINIEYDDIIPSGQIQKKGSDVYVNHDENYAPPLISVNTAYHHEYSAGGTRRGKTHDITFQNIHLWGRHTPVACFSGYDEEHQTRDILIENVYLNGGLLKKLNMECGKFTDHITYKTAEKERSESV